MQTLHHPAAPPTKDHLKVRINNFDAIRLLLAVTVFFAHSYILSNNPSLAMLGRIFNAKVAVESFFVISGFLIFMSYENSKSVKDYAKKRVRRIYPAYFAVVLFCAIGGAFITSVPFKEYIAGPVWKYLAANLSFAGFLYRSLPGVFASNHFPDVNGALWTIKVEVMFYLSVPVVVAMMRRLGILPVLTAVYCLSLIYRLYCEHIGASEMAKQLPGQMCFFVGGALIYYYFDSFERVAPWILLAAVVMTFAEWALHVNLLYPLCLAVIVIYVACFLPVLTRFRPKWDLSYGVYIFHFPVLQSLVSLGWLAGNPGPGVLLAAVITFSLACLSWNLLERRFLERRRPRQTSTSAANAY